VKAAEAPSTLKPAPFAAAAVAAPEATVMLRSSTSRVVLLIVVVVPSTCRLPATIRVPVLSPCAAGSIVNDDGPRRYPDSVMFVPLRSPVSVPPLAVRKPEASTAASCHEEPL